MSPILRLSLITLTCVSSPLVSLTQVKAMEQINIMQVDQSTLTTSVESNSRKPGKKISSTNYSGNNKETPCGDSCGGPQSNTPGAGSR